MKVHGEKNQSHSYNQSERTTLNTVRNIVVVVVDDTDVILLVYVSLRQLEKVSRSPCRETREESDNDGQSTRCKAYVWRAHTGKKSNKQSTYTLTRSFPSIYIYIQIGDDLNF